MPDDRPARILLPDHAIPRRDFLALAGLGATALVGGRAYAPRADAPRRPNILVIVADDLGYADLGCQGCKDVPTPNIDSIAQGGVRFTDGHVSCPVCSPTRAGLLTGRYQQRFGHEFNPGPMQAANLAFGLPLSEVTLADALKAAGYATGMVGKWHLGYQPQFHPLKRGFDEYYGFLGGAHPYLRVPGQTADPILRGTEPVDEKEYLTEAFAREAVAFIDRHKEGPFFLYLTFNAVHVPQQATEKYLQRFPGIVDPKRQLMAAMLSGMDDAVGAVLGKLREVGVLHETLIFFVSDNGGPTATNGSLNTPLRGYKGGVNEGGIRVPFLMQWTGRIPAGALYEKPVISLDILPTAVAAAGGALPTDRLMDGVDLVPYLSSSEPEWPHPTLFWRFGEPRAVRSGNWKLIRQPNVPDVLYDLNANIGESPNVADQHPDIAAALSQQLATWEAGLIDPLWRRAAPAQPREAARRRRERRAARQAG